MRLARRLTLLFAATAVLVSGAIGGLSYAATDHSLDTEIRNGLEDAATALARGETPEGLPPVEADHPLGADGRPVGVGQSPFGDDGPGQGTPDLLLAQLLGTSGTVSSIGGRPTRLPVLASDRQIAQTFGDRAAQFRVITVNGSRYLLLTRAANHPELVGGAVQVARSLSGRDGVLARLAVSIVLLALGVALVAALAGWFLARRLTRGLVKLTAVAERVSATGRLDVAVPAAGSDEVGRLGAAFDTMLDRLARSKDDQQRLVQDAGHELRTPLTSIRTNLSLLRRYDELDPEERIAVLDDLAGESRELTELVNELVELATDRRAEEAEEDVDLVALAERVAERAGRRYARSVEVRAPAAELVLHGRPAALERALSNLVDNAVKFDVEGYRPVEIVLSGGRLEGQTGGRIEVRDRGPGVPEDELPRIFDRFHRATAVRSLPGSGLGLSIVQDVAVGHGGEVFAANRDGGGAVIGFTLSADRFQTGSYPG